MILPILILLVSATCIPCLIYQAIKRRIREVQERHRKEDDKKKEEDSESNRHQIEDFIVKEGQVPKICEESIVSLSDIQIEIEDY